MLMYFHDLGTHYNDEVLLAARDKAVGKLLSTQFRGTGNPRLDGAFQRTFDNPDVIDGLAYGRRCGNMRTSAYALMALRKLESDLQEIWLGRHNEPFVNPLHKGTHDLIW